MTCREKAIAIYQGKAEAAMCLIRSYETHVPRQTLLWKPHRNLIFIFDKEMRIREFNRRAEDVFHTSRQDALRMYLFELIDTKDFEEVYHTHENKLRVKQKWEQYNMTVLETIVYIPSSDRVLAIIEDVSAEEKQAERMLEQKLNTVKWATLLITT